MLDKVYARWIAAGALVEDQMKRLRGDSHRQRGESPGGGMEAGA